MVLVHCASRSSVIPGTSVRKHGCLHPTLSYVPLLDSTKGSNQATLSDLGCRVYGVGTWCIMHLGTVMMSGSNGLTSLPTRREYNTSALSMLLSPLSTYQLSVVPSIYHFLSMPQCGQLPSAHFLDA